MLGLLGGGLALCALGLWVGRVYQHNEQDFHAQALATRAVIDQVYDSAPSQGYYAPTFDQYALVHFAVGNQTAHARVRLSVGCSAVCAARYRVGQVITVDYAPGNLSYAELPSRGVHTSLYFWYAFGLLAFFGAIFIAAAVIRMFTA